MKKLKDHTPLTKEEIREIRERLNHGVENRAASLLFGPCSPCEKTSPNGGCYEVSGACIWIPAT